MDIKVSIKDFGIFMIGLGILILSLIALHFYLSTIHYSYSQDFLGAYCNVLSSNTAVVTVKNYGDKNIVYADVYVNDKHVCRLKDIYPYSSDACLIRMNNNTLVFKVIAVTADGRKMKDAGVCYLSAKPVPVR